MSPVAAPPWTSPLSRFMWDRMWSWANALRGKVRPVELRLVPVWTALAEEVWDRQWERQVLAVESADAFRVLTEPTRPLDVAVSLQLEVTEDAAVVTLDRMSNRVGDAHVRIGRRMGPYGVICRVNSVRLIGEPTVHDAEPRPPLELILDPWTQVMVPRVQLDDVPRRGEVDAVIRGLSDWDA